jgi:hypothetical protein
MRPAANAFSGFSTTPRKASWDELSREREADGETKNYSVPPELIELARANRKGRGQVGTLTPLAPKPPQDVVVVVPAAAPLARDIASASGSAPESSSRAPSVPIPDGASSDDPDSARTAVYAAGQAERAMLASSREGAPVTPSPVPTSPLAELMRAELAAAAGDGERQPGDESSGGQPSSAQPSSAQPSSSPRRSSRRARRSSRVEMPVEATIAARAAAAAETPRIYSYVAYATGAVLVGGYITLCYYANALLSGLP